MKERLDLAFGRIQEIKTETFISEPFLNYFQRMASFLAQMEDLIERVREHEFDQLSQEELKDYNKSLYQDIMPENYEESYGNPVYAVRMLGKDYGPLFSFLYTQLRGIITCAYELEYRPERLTDITILLELFLEVYCSFTAAAEEKMNPQPEEIRQILYYYVSDYADTIIPERIREQLDPACDFATRIIMESDLSDFRYLYRFGEYISENELLTAAHLLEMTEEQIQAMADTYTEGYRIGFVMTGKDLSKKKVVNIRYCLGFERVVRAAIKNYEKMGLKPVIYRAAFHAAVNGGNGRIGYYGAIPNKQYDYDHKEDQALFFDKAYLGRKLELLHLAYEQYKELAFVHAGPAVMEVFGEQPFTPVNHEEACALSEKQQKLLVEYASEAGKLVNQYIKGEERSYTIISYPVPEIGADYKEIFDETVRINTLNYREYQKMQQAVIDVLDQAVAVEILGKGANRTNLTIALRKLEHPEKETQFENCVADVNIPVGEVFTSPVLKNTTGCLFVSEVYLEGLRFENLELDFTDGFVTDYTCTNFEKEEENRKYIKDNILFHHETLPMGEFAIGTNTTAYAMAKRFHIFDRLPILIAEKTGPHFAVGDTCYSHAEEVKVYNPDGKEIISRENDCSLLRKTNPQKAYFNCHTDITIPYEEIKEIMAVTKEGEKIPVIADGKFTVLGCESLNIPLESLIDAR